MSEHTDYDRPPNLHRMQEELNELRREMQELIAQVKELRAKVTACEVRQIKISQMIEDRGQH